MSLMQALSAATSGLKVVQTAITTTASNITNADSDGYTRKVVSTEATSTGVAITGIDSIVDQNLRKLINSATTELGKASVEQEYLDTLQSALGTTTDNNTVASAIDELISALDSLSLTPEGGSEASAVIQAAEQLATEINAISNTIQELRTQADRAISDAVDSANTLLHRISDLNKQIKNYGASGQSTADLEDQRAMALEDLSGLMDITSFTNTDNEMRIYTTDGTPLLAGSVRELSFTPSNSITANLIYEAGASSGLSGITVGDKDITSSINSGEIGGLINLRDDLLPQHQDEIDALRTQLVDTINTAHNNGTSVPPPNSLTSADTVDSTTALAATGSVRIATLDETGVVVESTDLDLTAYTNIGDLIDAIDAISGIDAAVDANGYLVITASDADQGVAIAAMDGALGSNDKNFSSYFGLNDLFVSSDTGQLSVRSDIASNSSLLATGAMDDSTALTTGDIAVSEGSNAIVSSLTGALTSDQTFESAGNIGSGQMSISEYAAELIASTATDASTASTTLNDKELVYEDLRGRFSEISGVNLDEETAELAILEEQYQAIAQILSVVQEMFDALLAAV